MKIPNAERAVVNLVKLSRYCLSPDHPRGRHKARVFAAALGFTVADAPELRDLLSAAVQGENAVPVEQDRYGQRYTIDSTVSGHTGVATIRSSWIVLTNENFPRFVTCYVL